ncbi:hypothetical protein PSCT_02612 [Pseudomonas sp. SCT]|uniref:hypothetical protein n=1 Tax=Pseudomonas sp. (strain SCT) TaxID=412955 RepID=UPI000EDDE503|nr:hypothetical protein [Pseudomonas sp. SCT]GCA56411.1 hypothetical protein PSCT_02612 [Pseudomonas sp. SCT]
MTQQSIASRVGPAMTSAELLAQAGIEVGQVLYSVKVRFPDGGLAQQFPGLTVCGVAVEVMERLKKEYPNASVNLIRYGVGIENRAEAEALTERTKEAIIDARDKEYSGRALLQELEFWTPTDRGAPAH